jgi:hypothetical protein
MKNPISKIELEIVRSQLAGFILFEIGFLIAYGFRNGLHAEGCCSILVS